MQTVKYLLLAFILISFLSCEKDEEVDTTAQVTLNYDDLFEVENATIPLGFNIGIDNPRHAGGAIDVSVTGGTYGVDFETSGGSDQFSIEVDPGSLVARFTVQPVDDDLIDEESVVLTISLTGTTGSLMLGDQTSFTLTILNDDRPTPPMVEIDAAPATILEDTGTITIPLIFTKPLEEDAVVEVVVNAASTAMPGSDFTINGEGSDVVTLSFIAGTQQGSFDLEIIDDEEEEEEEVIELELMNPTNGLELGANTRVSFNILDNDAGVEPFFYLETFEGFDPEDTTYLTDVIGYQVIKITQTENISNTLILINNPGSFADENDVNGTSDHGLNLFYNSQQDPANYGQLDNMAITPFLDAEGMMSIEIDVSYAFKNQNNGEVTFYVSDTYDGSGNFDEGEWTVIGNENVANMDGEGFGNNTYKRKTFEYEATGGFYIGMRVNQTIDESFYRTRWRFDNIRVSN